MDSESLPCPVQDVIHQNLSEGAVLLLPSDEVYFGLNEVGALVWSLLPPATQSFGELCDKVFARYPDVSRATIEQDVRELLDDLLTLGLVSPVTSGGVEKSGRDSTGS